MTPLEAAAVLAAGVGAGAINAVVGSGTLITFPTLLAVGFPPVLANTSNTVGLVPGSLSAAWGYRAELKGQRARLVRLGFGSLLGSLLGGVILLGLPARAFQVIVPVLIVVACVLVIVQPRLNTWLAGRGSDHRHGGPWLWAGVFGAGTYGGYFGAAQGVLLIGLLGSFLDDDLQRINAAKNVLAAIVNGSSAVLFLVVARIDWHAALLIAVGSTIGALLGARIGRRLPAWLLRAIIVAVGIVAVLKLTVWS